MDNSRLKYITHPIIAITTFVATVAIMVPLVPLPLPTLILDGAIYGLLLAVLNFLLKEVMKYANYQSLSLPQQIVNYGALALLFVLCWVGIGFLTLYILFPEDAVCYILPTVPARIVVALLTYALMTLIYGSIFAPNSSDEESREVNNEEGAESESTEKNSANETTCDNEILEHIAVKNGAKIDLIFIGDIISIQAEGNYVLIFTPKGKYLKEQTMKYFGDRLPSGKFVRVHRSSIINIDYIQRIELYEKQSQMVKLKNNLQVKMSIAGYRELKKTLNL